MGAEGYRYDEAAGQHVFAYQEEVPFWWGMKKPPPPIDPKPVMLVVPPVIFFGILVSFPGTIFANFVAAAGLAFLSWLFLSWMKEQPDSRRTFTNEPDPRRENLIYQFAAELRVDLAGTVTAFREHAQGLSHDPQKGTQEFPLDTIASIERRSFADERPDFMATLTRHYESAAAKRQVKKRLEQARQLELIIIVFTDGQEIDAGWKEGRNPAAQLQASLIEFIGEMRTTLKEHRSRARHAAALDPDDAPL